MTTDLFIDFVSVCFDGVQSRAAEALELDRSTVSRICAGERGITPQVAARIEELSEGRFRKESFIWPDSQTSH